MADEGYIVGHEIIDIGTLSNMPHGRRLAKLDIRYTAYERAAREINFCVRKRFPDAALLP